MEVALDAGAGGPGEGPGGAHSIVVVRRPDDAAPSADPAAPSDHLSPAEMAGWETVFSGHVLPGLAVKW